MRGSRRFFMLACQMSRAGSGPARNVGGLGESLAFQAPKLPAEVYRGLYTGVKAQLTNLQTRRFAWEAGLDRPPPDVVVVEYDSAETDHFIELADAIEECFPGVAVDGHEKETSPKGFFRVRAGNGDILFVTEEGSGGLPDPQRIVSILKDAGYPAEE